MYPLTVIYTSGLDDYKVIYTETNQKLKLVQNVAANLLDRATQYEHLTLGFWKLPCLPTGF